ncbi:MAG: hypothetical protein QM723_22650 [Myxococcaceae bacterium]
MLGALLAVSLTQAAVTPPETPPPAPVAEAPVQLNPNATKVHLLEERIHALDVRIASVNESWPQGSVMLMFAGVSFGPLMTVLGGVCLGLEGVIPALLVPGLVVLVVGLVGVALLVWGAMQASKASADARAEKAALLKEREAAQAELDTQLHSSREVRSLPVFALEF